MSAPADGRTASPNQTEPAMRVPFEKIAHRPPATRRKLGGFISGRAEISGGRMLETDPKLASCLARTIHQFTLDAGHRFTGKISGSRVQAGENGSGF